MLIPLFNPETQTYDPNGYLPPQFIPVAFLTIYGQNLIGHTSSSTTLGITDTVFMSNPGDVYRADEVISWRSTVEDPA